MPVLTLELPQPIFDRLSQLAAERSVPLEAVVRQLLTWYVETPDPSSPPHPDSFRPPKRPAKFDRAKVEALLADLEDVKRLVARTTGPHGQSRQRDVPDDHGPVGEP